MMKRNLLYICLSLGFLIMVSCGKEGAFPSIPSLKYVSIYPSDTATKSGDIRITCTFKDAEGDIKGNGTLFYKAVNITRPSNTDSFVSYGVPVPNFPQQNNVGGEMIVILNVSTFIAPKPGNDSYYIDLYLKDKAGHYSDTIRTDTIVIKG